MDGKKSISKIKFIILLIPLLSTILLISCTPNTPVNNDTKIKDTKEEITIIKEKNKYQKLILRFGHDNNPQPSDLFARDDFLNIEKEINLHLNQNYDYIEVKFQPLYYIGDYAGDKNFAISEDTINQEINTGSEILNFTDLKTMQIGDRMLKNFSMEIADGRTFNSEDFIVSEENQIINIILGNNYINEYNLNDILTLNLHAKNIKFKVIGFLGENTSFDIGNDNIILDDYILMPFYNIEYTPNNKQDERYQQIWYSQKNEGFIRPNDEETIDDLKENIDVINKKYDLFFEIVNIPVSFKLN